MSIIRIAQLMPTNLTRLKYETGAIIKSDSSLYYHVVSVCSVFIGAPCLQGRRPLLILYSTTKVQLRHDLNMSDAFEEDLHT